MMVSPFHLFLLITFFAHFSFIGSARSPASIVARLIHRDSKKSPCYNAKTESSIFKCAGYRWRSSRHPTAESYNVVGADDPAGFEAHLVAGEYFPLFFVEFHIGSQSDPQYAVMDTGSSLLWIQCVPCIDCSATRTQMYDPSTSPTYKDLHCYDRLCNLGSGVCDTDLRCKYKSKFINSKSSGYLGTETLRFEPIDGEVRKVSDVVFGCGHNNTVHPEKLMGGVFGLGYHNLSLAVRFGKFSHCVARIGDPDYAYNELVLGDDAILEGDSTTLEFDYPFYYVTMEGISLDGTMLNIPPGTFTFTRRNNRAAAGVIMDSGAPFTSLVFDAFVPVIREIVELLSILDNWPDEDAGERWCFKGDADMETRGFPTLRFHFAGGAELALEPDSLFSQYNKTTFCANLQLAQHSVSIIGMYAQQYYNVGYDILGKKIYFQRTGCGPLDN